MLFGQRPQRLITRTQEMQPTSKQFKILVVDDERQIRLVLKTALVSRGYAVRTAEDGDEALHAFNAWTPDLVITDLCMPNMDGSALPQHPVKVGRTGDRAFR